MLKSSETFTIEFDMSAKQEDSRLQIVQWNGSSCSNVFTCDGARAVRLYSIFTKQIHSQLGEQNGKN